MSESDTPQPGTIAWTDLTVPNAEEIRSFYSSVVGWEASPVAVGSYNDFNLTLPGSGKVVAGICHARGANADLPAQWLVYIVVEDLDASLARCRKLGGRVVSGPKKVEGYGSTCVIQDPAGAVAALFEPKR